MRRYSLLITVFLIAGFMPLLAQTYTFTSIAPFTFTHVYNTTSIASGYVTVTRSPKPSKSTSAYFLVSGTGQGSFQVGERKVYKDDGSSIPVSIFNSTSTASEIGTDTMSNPLELTFTISKNNGKGTANFRVQRGAGNVPDGVYSNTFSMQLYYGSTSYPSGIKVSGAVVTFSVTVTVSLAQVTVDISPANLVFNNGLSMLPEETYIASATMIVDSTRPFTMIVSSTYNGNLVLDAEEMIPYTFKLDGSAYPINPGGTDLPSGSAGYNDYNLEFSVTNLGFVEPGTYMDNITFTVTTQ